MNIKPLSKFIETNGIKLHYIHYEGDAPTIILMHGLTANAHAFDGLVRAGLAPLFNIISVDLRGRGLSEHPENAYSIAEHAKDIIGLLDHLNIQRAILGGHSFGGLLSIYMANFYPTRVTELVLMDAAARMHHNTPQMLVPAMGRLGQTFPSFYEYIQKIKKAPYNSYWEETMESYYYADVLHHENGTVTPRSKPANISDAVKNILSEPWTRYISGLTVPAILLNATGIYNLDAPLLPEENALETVKLMRDCRYINVEGNHQTMLYGAGARQIVEAIEKFLH